MLDREEKRSLILFLEGKELFHRRRDNQRNNNWRNPQMETRGNHPLGYTPQGREDQPLNPPPNPFEHDDPSTLTPVTCFNCNQPDHYANQCPNNIRGKAPTLNMITVDVQDVMGRPGLSSSAG